MMIESLAFQLGWIFGRAFGWMLMLPVNAVLLLIYGRGLRAFLEERKIASAVDELLVETQRADAEMEEEVQSASQGWSPFSEESERQFAVWRFERKVDALVEQDKS